VKEHSYLPQHAH